MSQQTFVLPDVGEGLTEAEIVSWKVAAGDTIELNQVLVEIETAKSLVELPSPYAGTVAEVLVAEGVTVEVGAPLIRVATTGADGAPGAADGGEADAVAALVADTAGTVDHEDDAPAPLVGYGSGGHGPTRRHSRHPGVPSTEPRPGSASRPAAQDATGREAAAQAAAVLVPGASAVPVIAKPPVRKLAKDLGVDLTVVTATGPIGEVTREDVIREAHQASVFHNIETPEWPETREDRIPVKGVRKAIATAMVTSAFTAPHVSVFTDVDATRTMEFVARLKNSPDFAGVKVSPLLIMAKAIIWAVQRNPTVNSTWTDEEIIVHHFVNLGVAAATPRGLIVPNVKEAQGMSLRELAEALQELTLTAREGRTQPVEMAGGTITVTNIGVFGMDTGTPILNPGEVAIVALGTIKQRPWVVDGEVRPRYVTTVGASFDHRVVDGDVASRFTADVAAIMEEPALLLD